MNGFIWELPVWTGSLQFDAVTIRFLLDIFLVSLGILLCFKGLKLLETVALLTTCLLCGYGGSILSEWLTQSLVFKLLFFSLFAFMGVCVLYFVWTILAAALKPLPIGKWVEKKFYWLTAVLGGGMAGLTVWMDILRLPLAVALGTLVLTVAGIVWQVAHKDEQRVAHTYDDLYNMKREELPCLK